ncbi:MAG: putative metal-dependent hydrolase [Blastocatellia bacterium]|nr:putative metal-dependent hydrolase [Blastocatellia bacterium]
MTSTRGEKNPMSEDRSNLIAAIEQLPAEAEAVVAGLDDVGLDTPYRDGGWSPRQVIHHLADSHMNAFIRMRLVVTEDNPAIKPYDQDAWALLPDSLTMPVAPSLSLLSGLHARWVGFLRSLPDDAFSRTAFHPEHGELTLDRLVAIYGKHGRTHCQQIRDLRDRMGW